MLHKSAGRLSRRSLLKSATAFGAAGLMSAGGVSLFNVRRSLAAELPDPASVLAKINVGNYVKKDYRDLYKLADDEQLWDPTKDWIRTVDWENGAQGIRRQDGEIRDRRGRCANRPPTA